MWPPPAGGTWVLDLDGWSGSPDAHHRRRRGDRPLARCRRPRGVRDEQFVAHAGRVATPAGALRHRVTDDNILRSADVAAGLLQPGTTALVIGDDGIIEALADRGVAVVPEGPADAVVVGWTHGFTSTRWTGGPGGARGGPPDRHERGCDVSDTGWAVPGAGALLAAVATAARRRLRWPESPTGRRPTPSQRWCPRGSAGHGGGPAGHRRRAGRPAGDPVRSCLLGRDQGG